MYKCSCCGFYTLPFPSEIALAHICPVCFWENDVFIKSDNEPSDENGGLTLVEGRMNYIKYGAVEEHLALNARKPTNEERHGC